MRLLTIVVFLALGACADPSGIEPFDACPCAQEDACGADYCSYSFRLSDTCEGSVDLAEVWIDGHLEASLLRPGQETPMVPCTRTAPGESAEIFVRGGAWLWGSETPGAGPQDPMVIACETAGAIHERSFECQEKATETP